MYRKLRNILARVKRKIIHGSKYHPDVRHLLKIVEKNPLLDKESTVYVNISFDFELALNGKFWEGKTKEALNVGKKALINFSPIANYLNKENIPYNIQIVCGLLDNSCLLSKKYLSQEQVNIIKSNIGLFSLNEAAKRLLISKNVEIGIHGFSHKSFQKLNYDQAEEEIDTSVKLIAQNFNTRPSFMSFPDNEPAYLDILRKYNLNYRTSGGVPLGLHFSSAKITPKELDYLIKKIKAHKKNYLLHLWQHFIEMGLPEFKKYITILRQNNCRIINLCALSL